MSKTILITGGAGFIGSHVVRLFVNKYPDYKIINSVDYQKGTAFQMKQDPENHSGFCVTWTILFVHYRLLNPKLQLPILIKYLATLKSLKLVELQRS